MSLTSAREMMARQARRDAAVAWIHRYLELRAAATCAKASQLKPVRVFVPVDVSRMGTENAVQMTNVAWMLSGSGPKHKTPSGHDTLLRLAHVSRMLDDAGRRAWPGVSITRCSGTKVLDMMLALADVEAGAMPTAPPWVTFMAMVGVDHHEQARRKWARFLDELADVVGIR